MNKSAFDNLMLENQKLRENTQSLLKHIRNLVLESERFNIQARETLESSANLLAADNRKTFEPTPDDHQFK